MWKKVIAAVMIAMVVGAAPAHAFMGLGMAEGAANARIAEIAAYKRALYANPNMRGEALAEALKPEAIEKAINEARANRAVEDVLFGKDAPAMRERAEELNKMVR